MLLADRFRDHAVAAEREGSALYVDWSLGLASDAEALRLVERAPEARRQPALVLAVCRWLGAPLEPWPALRDWLLAHGDAFVAELGRRQTQVNDVRRLGPVSLALARLEGPIALLEIGASAGLCLLPDRFAFRASVRDPDGPGDERLRSLAWGDPDSPVAIDLHVDGPLPGRVELPPVVWRAGIDLDPVDVTDPAAVSWLETLLPPGPTERVELLRRAVAIARSAPPRIVRGDAVDALRDLAAGAPPEAQLVVVSTGTLVYLPGRRRQAFVDAVRALDARWVSYERRDLLHDVVAEVPDGLAPGADFAALALDGRAIGVGDAHGTRLRMLPV